MQLNPYLVFNGTCEEAFTFYAKTFKGKIKAKFPFEGSPMAAHMPPEWQKKMMHVSLDIGGQVLMGSDAQGAHYEHPQGFSVSVSVKKVSEAERIFKALEKKGRVKMPLQQTFWAARFGMVSDRFGIPWMINCEEEAA
jgi:PhnB protein